MTNRLVRFLTALALSGFLVLAACGTTEPMLESKNATPPISVDFSGQWQLRDFETARRRPQAEEKIIIPDGTSRRQRTRRQRSPRSSVYIFLEQGSALKVSQTPYSLFFSYDRSIVEEYTFGENRLINVGPIEAKRVSGWDGVSFVVETLDREGATLFETWSLQSPAVLQRDVRIVEKEKEVFTLQQLFDRS